MTRAALSLLGLSAAAGCGGTAYDYSGHTVHEYFPLEGDRSWEYIQDDLSVGWQLEVEKLSNVNTVGNTEVVTLEYAVQDPFELLYSVKWSSDSHDGVLIHGYAVEGGEDVTFNPPVVFGDYQMTSGDTVETQTGGYTFTTELIGVETCPNHWTTDWECLHMVLDDGDGDDNAGPPFTGEYWITTGWGTSIFRPTGYAENWVLSYASWEPEAE